MHIRRDVLLAPYTTYKIGGPADFFVEAHSEAELVEAIAYARAETLPMLLIGLGANVLITDKGFRGIVILNRADAISIDGSLITAESGATIADLIVKTHEAGLSGLEHFAGIPSTVGGALWQNLHFLSPDRQRTVYIEEVTEGGHVLDGNGVTHDVDRAYFKFGYDESVFREDQGLVALSARFRLVPEDKAVITDRIEANLKWRNERQPSVAEFPSCGSVFKKIEGVGAGRLIEQSGLKGRRIGGAEVSDLHANFIVNVGGATAANVLELIGLVQAEVKRVTGYELETEINIVGER
jgi:UDP-N-acetylmuramate dehydrogenase